VIRTLHHTTRFDPSGNTPGSTFLEQLVARSWPHHLAPFAFPTKVASLEVSPVVNHGRWIVECPFCPGAQMADPEDRRFFCVDCLHAGTPAEGAWIRVAWPAPDRRATAEEILEGRPAEATRNWTPTAESIPDLRRENAERL
jgi:hypothetical protein